MTTFSDNCFKPKAASASYFLLPRQISHVKRRLFLLLSIFGPGLVVMLADTDAGSIITAAQSGAVWGYHLLLIQFILIPILYLTQELTIRLGVVTKMGHGELIKAHFGKFWAGLSVSTLIVCSIGALISEFSGIASAAALFHIPKRISILLTVIFLASIVLTGSYRRVECCAIVLGFFEIIFLVVAWQAHPHMKNIISSLNKIPIHNTSYLYLAAANVGAVIMPWMIFYQQSTVVDKGLTVNHLKVARWDTFVGAILTQIIMAAVLIASAATIGKINPNTPLNNVAEISRSITPFLGEHMGRLLFVGGILGASLVAAIVVSLTVAWGLGELTGFRHSLSYKPQQAPYFYLTYGVCLLVAATLVLSKINLVRLNISIEVMNAMLLPIVLGFLYLLARKTLPNPYRLSKIYSSVVIIILFTTAGFGLFSGIYACC